LELEGRVRSIYVKLALEGELIQVDGMGSIEEVGRRLYEEVKARIS
jgi:thymidylate kinase